MFPRFPSIIDTRITSFMKNFNLSVVEMLEFKSVDTRYLADFCHVSAKDAVINGGGRRVHGWALWEFENHIVGNFHSVWERPDGTLVDVTPPKVGTKIMFVRDPSLAITNDGTHHILYQNRTSEAALPFIDPLGKSTHASQWKLANSSSSLIDYCRLLGWKDASMV